ncbi:hypothetical protein D3C80_2184370 [compost metagenome]
MAKHHNCLMYTETSALNGLNCGTEFYEMLAKSSLMGLHLNNSSDRKEKKCVVC